MAAIDNIRNLAQDCYYTVNGVENDDTGTDLEIFENEFIRGFNLYLDELDTEAYWNQVRVDDFTLATVSNTSTYSFRVPDRFRSPVINQNKYVKFINDGTVIARFKLVDPSQRVVDDDYLHEDRATFVGRNLVLSRAPKETELTSKIVLDFVEYFPKLTRKDDSVIALLPSRQLGVLGWAKNISLSNVTKVSLSPSFAQKYNNELQKQIAINNATNEIDEMRGREYGYITGIW